ncbi:MAG: hypothetical protein DDT24_00715 [Chloroflexi bacterium]|nr:hypothetical protein [Chloroflexota bacterium]
MQRIYAWISKFRLGQRSGEFSHQIDEQGVDLRIVNPLYCGIFKDFADHPAGPSDEYGHVLRPGMRQHREMDEFLHPHNIRRRSGKDRDTVGKEGVLPFALNYHDIAVERMLMMDHLFVRPLTRDRMVVKPLIAVSNEHINEYRHNSHKHSEGFSLHGLALKSGQGN